MMMNAESLEELKESARYVRRQLTKPGIDPIALELFCKGLEGEPNEEILAELKGMGTTPQEVREAVLPILRGEVE